MHSCSVYIIFLLMYVIIWYFEISFSIHIISIFFCTNTMLKQNLKWNIIFRVASMLAVYNLNICLMEIRLIHLYFHAAIVSNVSCHVCFWINIFLFLYNDSQIYLKFELVTFEDNIFWNVTYVWWTTWW